MQRPAVAALLLPLLLILAACGATKHTSAIVPVFQGGKPPMPAGALGTRIPASACMASGTADASSRPRDAVYARVCAVREKALWTRAALRRQRLSGNTIDVIFDAGGPDAKIPPGMPRKACAATLRESTPTWYAHSAYVRLVRREISRVCDARR
jgi:hypothetical protein